MRFGRLVTVTAAVFLAAGCSSAGGGSAVDEVPVGQDNPITQVTQALLLPESQFPDVPAAAEWQDKELGESGPAECQLQEQLYRKVKDSGISTRSVTVGKFDSATAGKDWPKMRDCLFAGTKGKDKETLDVRGLPPGTVAWSHYYSGKYRDYYVLGMNREVVIMAGIEVHNRASESDRANAESDAVELFRRQYEWVGSY